MKALRNCKKQVCHIPSSLTKSKKIIIITVRKERRTRHQGSPTTKKLGGIVQVLTKDELPNIAKDKRRSLVSNFGGTADSQVLI